MVESLFLAPAESRNSPVEGELLGVVNALHKTRYYTQGAEKLIIGTVHKPLLGVLDKSMELIDNPRLQRLAQKILSWNFRQVHIPGRKLGGPDALSRHKESAELAEIDHQSGKDWEDAVSCKETRGNMFAILRLSMDPSLTAPDPEWDTSGEMLAAMETGVRSITW